MRNTKAALKRANASLEYMLFIASCMFQCTNVAQFTSHQIGRRVTSYLPRAGTNLEIDHEAGDRYPRSRECPD